VFENAFKAQWADYVRHVVAGEPFPWDLLEGAKGVQLTEASHRSWQEGRRIDVGDLPV
jgi:predicted dehydrogenase